MHTCRTEKSVADEAVNGRIAGAIGVRERRVSAVTVVMGDDGW
jgi:hypothetical protein